MPYGDPDDNDIDGQGCLQPVLVFLAVLLAAGMMTCCAGCAIPPSPQVANHAAGGVMAAGGAGMMAVSPAISSEAAKTQAFYGR